MAIAVKCPDCGGIVGATEVTEAGYPCTCFGPPAPAPQPAARTEHQAEPEPQSSEPQDEEKTEKVCCVCGKDVSRGRRLRDSRGYWCYDCHKAEQERSGPTSARCGECNRRVPVTTLTEYEGLMICGRCLRQRRELAKQPKKFVVPDKAYRQYEKTRLIILFGILAVLLLIILLSRLFDI